ncbi:hypothetical protein HF521_002823 [Silurus meridionalis]|uniref:non-specific serine/threonine protein kinase n=1 Tax=Silurus meridionalis TaxID=175797 RepID=A0A8T0B2Z9_SILME|nr:hypothetical protein HF521_002823 [Silurus meridionalis]
MPSPIPVTRLLPRDFGLELGVCSSPLTKQSGDTTLRVPVIAFHGKLACRLWSSVIHWRELRDLEPIGSGGFGLVSKATYLGETVAMKRVRCAKNKLASRQSFWAELNAAHLRHENLVRVIAASTQSNADDGVIGTIIMEYAGDLNLQQLIYSAAEPLRRESCVRHATDVARALRHLHAHGVVHLDLKPANVLVSHAGVCKLADFGCSLKLEIARDRDATPRRMEIGGTYTHRAPELLRGEEVTPARTSTRSASHCGSCSHVSRPMKESDSTFCTPWSLSTCAQISTSRCSTRPAQLRTSSVGAGARNRTKDRVQSSCLQSSQSSTMILINLQNLLHYLKTNTLPWYTALTHGMSKENDKESTGRGD